MVVDPPSPTRGFEAVPVRRCALARGGAIQTPPVIEVEQVVEHALRHLAWLARDDAVVRRCLGSRWPQALDEYLLEPFRAMELEPPLARLDGSGDQEELTSTRLSLMH